jgi:predicted hydrocarbon binding protein
LKIEKTLIDFIDEALGNLDKGTSMLFVCDSLTLNDAITLCGLITISFVKQGGGCILVTTSLPFSMFFDEIKSRFAEEELPFLKKSLEKGMGYYIDISSEEASKEDLSNSKGIIKINNDPNRIMYEILFSGDQIKKGFPDIPVLISYQNFSSSIIDFGPEPVLKMFRKLTTSAKQKGYVITGLVNRDLHDSHVLNTLMHFADFVVELSSEKKGGVKQPYVQVLKSPNLEQNVTNLQQRYAYTLSGNSFSTIPALAPAFDELKRNISYLDSGALSIHNTKYLIMSLNTFLLLYKELEKNFKINEYSEFVKNFGKTVGLEITKLFKSEHRLGGNELLEEALNYVLLQGWGRLIKKEGSLESGRLKISYFETFARNYGKSDHKVSQIFEGILSGMLESVTGSKWSCRETKCIATGDELCEFEAEVEK